MAVEIPKIQRTQAPAPSQTQGLDTRFKGAAADTAKVGQAAEGFGEAAFTLATKYENEAINNEAIKRVNEYDDWYKKRLYGDSTAANPGLRNLEGDPTEAYNQFDNDAEAKYNELLSPDGLSSKAAGHVEKELLQRRRTLHGTRLMEYGNQNAQYTDKLYKGRLDIASQDTVGSMAKFDSKNPASAVHYLAGVSDIQRLHIDRAKVWGGAVETDEKTDIGYLDENNVPHYYKVSELTKTEIKKDISKATAASVKVLIDSGRVEDAEALMNNYPNFLDKVNQGELTKDLDKAKTEKDALIFMEKAKGKSYAEQKRLLNQMPTTTLREMKAKREALNILGQVESEDTALRAAHENEMYDFGANAIAKVMNSDEPFTSERQLEKSILTLENGMKIKFEDLEKQIPDSTKRAALREIFKPPKESDPEVLSDFMDKLAAGEVKGMSHGQLTQDQHGMNQADRTMSNAEWRKQNVLTDAQGQSRTNYAFSTANKAIMPLLKKNSGGKLTKGSLKVKNEMMTEVLANSDNLNRMSTGEVNAWIQERVAAKTIDAQKQKAGVFDRLFTPSASPMPSPTPGPMKKDYDQLSFKEREDLKRRFRETKQRKENDLNELRNWDGK